MPRTSRDLQNRADAYAWPGSLLEVGAALVLVPVFPFRQADGRRSISLRNEVPPSDRYIYFWNSGVFAYPDVEYSRLSGLDNFSADSSNPTGASAKPFWAQTVHPVHYLSDRDLCS